MPLTLPSDLDRRLVAFYRGWDRLERDQFHSSVIDFDLAERGEVPYLESRQTVLEELDRLRTLVAHGHDLANSLVRGRLRASATYLDALLNGVRLPLREYVSATMGIEPVPVSELRLRTAETQVRALLKRAVGNIPFSRKGFDRFRSELETAAGENLKRQFEFFCDKWLTRLCRSIGAELDASAIVVEFAEEDAYWKNWISGNIAEGQPITLRINVHARHVWYQGAVENLVLHEYCGHAVQMALWQTAVRQKAMASFFGILTVHFPDQFLLEGLAESIAHVLPNEKWRLEKLSEVIRELQRYNLLVLNNVHILANDRGLDVARTYARQHLPFTAEDTIERELRDRTSHPLFRTYQYVYSPAKEAFVTALVPLAGGRRWSLVQELFRTPMTPDRVREVFARTRPGSEA